MTKQISTGSQLHNIECPFAIVVQELEKEHKNMTGTEWVRKRLYVSFDNKCNCKE